jgi:CRP-like cAMP-binding protein
MNVIALSQTRGAERVVELLRHHPAFAQSPSSRLAELARQCTVIELPAGHVLFRAGEPARAVYVLVAGIMRVYQKASDEREVTISNLIAPSILGETCVIAESVGQESLGYLEHTMAIKPATLVEVPAPEFLRFVRDDAATMQEVLEDVCRRQCAGARRDLDVLLDVPERLASLFLAYVEIAGQPGDSGTVIKLPLTHEDLANGLGVAVKSIARTLKDWQTQGWVTRHKGWFVVRDASAIAALCDDAPVHLNYSSRPAARRDAAET